MLKTIVVALDDSELADQVIYTLQQLQMASGTKVILAHVIPPATEAPDVAADRPHAEVEDLPYRHIKKQLQTYQAQLNCETELEIVSGEPADEIIRLANIYHADLIVMGNRGLTGVNRILKGSVSSQVLESASCSVLVVKPKVSQVR